MHDADSNLGSGSSGLTLFAGVGTAGAPHSTLALVTTVAAIDAFLASLSSWTWTARAVRAALALVAAAAAAFALWATHEARYHQKIRTATVQAYRQRKRTMLFCFVSLD